MEKTLKQIADELNLSKQKVYRYVISNHITPSHRDNKTMWFDETSQELIKTHFINNDSHQKTASESPQNTSELTHYEAIIKTLTDQLEVKDRQIQQLQKLLDQEQQLRMVSKGNLLTVSESDHPKKWWQFWK